MEKVKGPRLALNDTRNHKDHKGFYRFPVCTYAHSHWHASMHVNTNGHMEQTSKRVYIYLGSEEACRITSPKRSLEIRHMFQIDGALVFDSFGFALLSRPHFGRKY